MFKRMVKKQRTFWENRRYKKIVIWSAVFAVLAAAGITGYILASNEPRVVEVTPTASEMPAGADDSKVAKGAAVEWEYEYRMCGHSIFLNCEADDNIVGFTFSQLQAENPNVRIVTFEPGKLVLKLSFYCYCPRHYILKQNRDELAIFRTILGSDEQEIYREVPLRFDDLSTDEQKVLESGKLFESLDELEYYIENLDT